MNKSFTNKIIYQIYPKSFLDTTGSGIGDINGVIKKLNYLKDLGVDYLWLSPICLSPQNDNGYDIADYYHIDPIFGLDEDYFELIKEAKKRNIKIMLDLVLNHTSSEHEWFKKALKGEKKYQDYYIWSDTPNNLMSAFGNSAWTFSKEVGKYYLHLFDETQPDLNWENQEVKKEIFKMINYWMDKGIEGFRLDVIDLIGKEPEKEVTVGGKNFHKLLKELRDNTFQDKVLTVGE
ncbi:MAG: alpha-amylase family glycosyl hydrolase, partial [Mycoplasmatales bacterium]